MKIKNIYIVLLMVLAVMTNKTALTQPPCDSCTYPVKYGKPTDYIPKDIPVFDNTNYMSFYYQPCEEFNDSYKHVAFVHGLGGSQVSWQKPHNWTFYEYPKSGVTRISYKGYETSMLDAIMKAHNEIKAGMDNDINDRKPNRCKDNDYVIAHSQGGIVMRYLDLRYDSGYAVRQFRGIVTFGSPHGGAHIGLTAAQHKAFITNTINSVMLVGLDENINTIINSRFGVLIADELFAARDNITLYIDSFISPMFISDFHSPTMAKMIPGTPFMNTLTNYTGTYSKVHRVAFYGTEDAPECWRALDNFVNKRAETYPLWGANHDSTFPNRVFKVMAEHEAKIFDEESELQRLMMQPSVNVKNKQLRKVLSIFVSSSTERKTNLKRVIENRKSSLTFLKNANRQWRFLIGAHHKDSFTTAPKLEYNVSYNVTDVNTSQTYNLINTFKTEVEADNFIDILNSSLPGPGLVYTSIAKSTNEIGSYTFLTLFPSDAIALVKSQKAFPRVREQDTDHMPGNNHFQMRNSEETKRVLENLYEGIWYDSFFKLIK